MLPRTDNRCLRPRVPSIGSSPRYGPERALRVAGGRVGLAVERRVGVHQYAAATSFRHRSLDHRPVFCDATTSHRLCISRWLRGGRGVRLTSTAHQSPNSTNRGVRRGRMARFRLVGARNHRRRPITHGRLPTEARRSCELHPLVLNENGLTTRYATRRPYAFSSHVALEPSPSYTYDPELLPVLPARRPTSNLRRLGGGDGRASILELVSR